ncbi:GH92 family glycosyl hydrolase [Edaphobacter flagellatus]|uniref:GH92 family glycosyl hydrolase n=1 Tax=Edaphobacter flagellatus TaxID=1933044 RepID=UPI0021B2AEC6|nr:GH92 family glycosyl hydrolase [Edaphobacter flagellatus]
MRKIVCQSFTRKLSSWAGKGAVLASSCLYMTSHLLAQEPFQAVQLVSGTSNFGQTAPMIGMPFAMTHWVPETRANQDKCTAPYYYDDKKISGFRGTHWLSGSCAIDYGSVTVMPTTGHRFVSPNARASTFRHAAEVMNPAYYSVMLDRYDTKVELTGGTRAGMMRVTFPSGEAGRILIEPNAQENEGFIEIHPEKGEIVGYNPVHRFYIGRGLPAGFSGYFVARFSAPFTASGTWCGLEIIPAGRVQNGGCNRLGGYAEFTSSTKPLLVKIGTSFTSLDEAARNLDAEASGWDFEGLEKKTEEAWKNHLNQIEIEGSSPEQRSIFYTALYHSLLVPRISSDADGTYNGFGGEGKLHRMERGDYFDDYSTWDTFRALHPLLTILDPRLEEEMVRSLIAKGEQGGYLPTFPLLNNYTAAMVGDHAGAIISDAYVKGLRDFDTHKAYSLMLQNATQTPAEEKYKLGQGRRALPSYLKYGYIPLEDQVFDAYHRREQVSRTLEYAYDDFAFAQMAKDLGSLKEYATLMDRSENWRNVFDKNVGFVRGRKADGAWIEPFDPTKPATYVTEETPYVATFFVPQNIPGLIEAMGGHQKFISSLDRLFEKKYYDHGNEPSHHIAYLYDYAGAAYKTQHQIRSILATEYHTGAAGLSGNDDAGQMSAWYIFSALGFYPVTPGTPSYVIGTPLFSKAIIHLPNGRIFTIVAKHQSAANEYIQSKTLNGLPLRGFTLSHSDIVHGGTLTFEMGPSPARE